MTFSYFFYSLRWVSKTRRVAMQFPNRLQETTRNLLIHIDIKPEKSRSLRTSPNFSVSISREKVAKVLAILADMPVPQSPMKSSRAINFLKRYADLPAVGRKKTSTWEEVEVVYGGGRRPGFKSEQV